jgi:LacI family transcriptional regulator, repressor for deo operon, udp, cdd, tsx, nupC, and nupG
MIKLKDVANLANVSTATVSRVLANKDTVSEETKAKVLEAVNKLNYLPNLLGRQLRKLETNTILVVVPDITNTFFSEVLRGIAQAARQNGYRVLLADTQNYIDSELDFLNYLRQKQVDGVILLTARTDSGLIQEFSHDYPIVLACEYYEGSSIPTVSIDNISSSRKITDHLIQLGHRRIAHISGPLNVVINRDRLKGYKQALAQHSLEMEPVLFQEGDFTIESGYNLMKKLLAVEHAPTAVFAANDAMAIGAVQAIKSSGLQVPGDIAVVGFDDIQMASILEPSLTTIAQPVFEIGVTSMNLLARLMKKEEIQKRHFVLEDKLVIRESCGFHSNRLLQKED